MEPRAHRKKSIIELLRADSRRAFRSDDVFRRQKTAIESLISLNKRNLELFNMNNSDSLFKLEASIGAVGTAWTADYSFPYFEEFIGSEYFSKVQNDDIKKQLRDLKARVVDATIANTFTDTQYQTVIEPYIIKNYNYQNSAMPRYQEFMIPGGPKTDYSKFLNDLEFWNILSLKQENLHQSKGRIESVTQSMKELLILLEQELSQ